MLYLICEIKNATNCGVGKLSIALDFEKTQQVFLLNG